MKQKYSKGRIGPAAKRIFVGILIVILGLCAVPKASAADSGYTVTVELSHKVYVNGEENNDFLLPTSYVLQPENGAPEQPDASFVLKKGGNKTLTFHFDSRGDYRYLLFQKTKQERIPDPLKGTATYDTAVFTLSFNIRKGRMNCFVYNEKGEKCKEASFKVNYVDTPNPPGTGDSSNLLLYMGAAAAALILIALMVYFRRHRRS